MHDDTYISADVQSFTSDYVSFVVVELIRFFHGATVKRSRQYKLLRES